MVGLGDLPGYRFSSYARGVSADGLTIVGNSISASGDEAFIWDQENGMVSLMDMLIAHGVDMNGWTLDRAYDISADGSTIVGWGHNPNRNSEAWVVTIWNCAPPLSGDVNDDGIINLEDITIVAANWLQPLAEDVNDDCIINLEDIAIIAAGWLQCNRIPERTCP